MRVGILTLSDSGAQGKRVDESGPAIAALLEPLGAEIVHYEMLPDDLEAIAEKLADMSDHMNLDVILTTGGTGLGPRDNTPEATRQILHREAPGLAEAIRHESLKKNPKAMMSRAVAGTRGHTLIINLPGSVRGASESLEVVLPILQHAVEVIRGGGHDEKNRPRWQH